MRVTEVRGSWIGGYALKDAQRYTGWVHRDEVKLVVIPAEKATRIEVPDVPDDAKAVAALRELKVKLDLNDKGNVHSADGSEGDHRRRGHGPLPGPSSIGLAGPEQPADHRRRTEIHRQVHDAAGTISGQHARSRTRVWPKSRTFPNLEVLAVSGNQVTGTGLEHVKGLKSLRVLNLSKCAVTDDGLANLEKMTTLGVLALNGSKVTNAGLVHLKSLPDLRVLNLIDCAVDDQGLEHLYGLEELRMLYVGGTKVTEAGPGEIQRSRAKPRNFRGLDQTRPCGRN